MFEKIKNLFRKGGAKMGIIDSLDSILDHPKISMPSSEYQRIMDNKKIYMQQFPDIEYLGSDGAVKKRPYHSINVAKIISRRLSKLVFNEGCEIKVDGEQANEFLQTVFTQNKFRKNFGEELEAGYAISGMVLRPYYDPGTETIKISYCSSDSFYPLHSNTNDISEAAIATVTQETEGKETMYYTLLEFHEWVKGKYTITNELYKSDRGDKVGVRVPLNSLEKYAGLEQTVVLEGFSRPIFVYVKLAGKNNASLISPLGAGVIDNAKKQLKDLNDKYDQFMWEIEKSKSKILASDHFFKTRYEEGKPVTRFDKDTDVFQSLKADDPFIDVFSPELHSDEYINSINFILRIIEIQTGFSAGTFSFDGQSVKTATEIISENTETYSTRSDNVLIVEEAIKELVITIFEMAQAYDLFTGTIGEISVDFDDGVFVSKESQLDYNSKAVTVQMMPLVEAMRRQFNLTEEEAKKWYNQIRQEQDGLAYDVMENQAITKVVGADE